VPRTELGTALSRWGWLLLWAVLVVVALLVRPLFPVDETRYLSVAWEMWRRGDWLVPYLNGHPYADKPPLLFWAMLLGWRVFGVNEWWPRLLSPLFALACVFLLARLARRLSPEGDAAESTLPFLSGLLWVTYSTLVLFDTLLAACVLLALLGVVDAWRGRMRRGWLAYAAGIGLGNVTKGPVVLVHVLPVALLAPWWMSDRHFSWRRWYVSLAGAVALGVGLALLWALPAAASGGSSWRTAEWHQVTGRIAGSFAHQRPWWWYLPLLPLVLFPWSLWPPLWRSLATIRPLVRPSASPPARFALTWVVPAFIILSLISGKQVHYLIPLLPGFALLVGLAYARFYVAGNRGLVALSLISPALLIAVHLAATRSVMSRYDLRPVARFLKEAELEGRPLANEGPYSGQFHFLGRLDRPFDEVEPAKLPAWAAAHPNGLAIRYARRGADTTGALLVRPYRDRMIEIWGRAMFQRNE
jgi:4-amino-4-deoxy-L-arabinose transferase-like glycosyltransferase